MSFVLRPESDEPLYKQISAGLRDQIASGSLSAETRLPSTRQLARDLAVSRITVENAYSDLIAEGAIESRQGSGTFVLPPWPLAIAKRESAGQVPLPAWQTDLKFQTDPDRDRMLRVGVPPAVSVSALFEAALREGVSFVAGEAFFPEPADQPFLRLNFAAIDEDEIERGIALLGKVLTQIAANSPQGRTTTRSTRASPI